MKKGGINISGSGNFISQTTNDINLELRKTDNHPENQNLLTPERVELLTKFEDKVVKLNQMEKVLNDIIKIKNTTILEDIDIKDVEKKKSMQEPPVSFKNFSEKLMQIQTETKTKDEFDHEIIKLKHELNAEIEKAGNIFANTINATLNKKMLIKGQLQKIGHKEYKEEGLVHFECISEIEKKLDFEMLISNDFTFLSNEGIAAVHIIKEIEKHNQVIETLVDADKLKTRKTKKIVIVTMSLVIALLVAVMVITSILNIDVSNKSIPLIDIPLQVIVWGFIGSFASMIYRFNKKPIYDFGNSIKWLITRPIQGIILSSAFYLVLVSSQFLLSGAGGDAESFTNSKELILVMSFLIGFSDKFADKSFNALIDKYTSGKNEKKQKKEAPEK